MNQRTVKYCVGCKLCQICSKAELAVDEKGFSYPVSGDQNWLESICPIGNPPMEYYDKSSVWGRTKGVYLGWSLNAKTRKAASSGGVLTEICCFLLRTGVVDGIIHISANPNCQTKNLTSISYTEKDIISKSGSRYSISSPLEILDKTDSTKKYALVGKPCDIVALRKFQTMNETVKDMIPITLSFFCMGLPSEKAQEKLLEVLDTDFGKLRKLTYRGNGWPGFATAINNDGSSKEIDYSSMWGKILGRDVMSACRFCLDGIGEAADISCGDAWYESNNGKPDFSEHEGRNVVFARSDLGYKILNEMIEKKVIILERMDDYEKYLSKVQNSQLIRRASMRGRILTMRLLRRPYPIYPAKLLNSYSHNISLKQRVRSFLGTWKRVIKGGI